MKYLSDPYLRHEKRKKENFQLKPEFTKDPKNTTPRDEKQEQTYTEFFQQRDAQILFN